MMQNKIGKLHTFFCVWLPETDARPAALLVLHEHAACRVEQSWKAGIQILEAHELFASSSTTIVPSACSLTPVSLCGRSSFEQPARTQNT